MSAPAIAPLESRRFGIVVMRATCATAEEVRATLAAARHAAARLVIARCDVAATGAAHELESNGAKLMETLVYFARNLQRELPPPPASITVHTVTSAADRQAVAGVAREAFRGYFGHFHADPRLDRAQSDAGYAEWAERCCTSREAAEVVLLAAAPQPAGFCALLRDGEGRFDIRLIAVAPAVQRRGIANALLVSAMHWARDHGADTLTISTQITNVASQKAVARAGFEPLRACYTFHWWCDDA